MTKCSNLSTEPNIQNLGTTNNMDSPSPISPESTKTSHSNEKEEEEDVYDVSIQRSGCYEQHIALQNCYFDNKDWRLCRTEMTEFKKCFDKHNASQNSS